MNDQHDDGQAADYYADPDRRAIAGKRPVRRKSQGLSTHVPIRFRPETLTAIRRLAAADGTTVSAWVRHVTEREIRRRVPPFTEVTYQARIDFAAPEAATETTDSDRLKNTFAQSA